MTVKDRTFKKSMSITLIIGLIFSCFVSAGFSASDLSGHWAKTQIDDWMDKGYIQGYPDGTFKPDAAVTRAEFMSMVNRSYMLSGSGGTVFKDVTASAWYASVVRIASASGYISGYPDGTIRPNAPISRYEAAVIIMNASKLAGDASGINAFNDSVSIPSWARDAVGAVYRQKIMTGYPNGTFSGTNNITRAEAVFSLSKSAVLYGADRVYSQPGTYGDTSMSTVPGDVIIEASGVTLRNMTINGTLTVSSEVGSGDVTLKNVIIKGTTTFNGGGPNSVYLDDVITDKIVVFRESGTLRLVVSGTSNIDQISARSDLKLEETSLSSSGAEILIIEGSRNSSVDIDLTDAKLDRVDMNSADSSLSLDSNSTITRVVVAADDTRIITEQGSVITTLVANEAVDISGAGTITRAEINVNGVSFEFKPVTVVLKSGITAPSYSNPSVESFKPADGATKVPLNSNIVITFTETLRNLNNTALTSANIDELVTLNKSSSRGASVDFEATVAVTGGKTVITVNPAEDFDAERSYYIAVEDMENFDNEAIGGSLSAIFTTVDADVPRIVSFNPENGADNVPVSSNIVISFSEVVRKTANTALTNTNVDSQIVLKNGSSSGTSVAFDATVTTVSNKTVITVNPTSNLTAGKAYYVAVSGLEDSDNQAVTGTLSAIFTTLTPTTDNLTDLAIAIGASGDGGEVTLNPTFSGSRLSYTATVSDSVTTVLVTPTPVSGNTAVVRLNSVIKAGGIVSGLVEGSNTITVTVSKTGATDKIYTVILTRADTTAPEYVSASLSSNKKLVTLLFTENLVSNTGDLKASITFASDGTSFVPLSSSDSVAISGKTLLIDFNAPLSGTNNVLSVAASALRDGENNILDSQVQTEKVSAE